jgi:DNA modification methylase
MTEPHYTDPHLQLWHGDSLHILPTLPDNSVDAVVTDPPYGLEFMGKEWDAPWKHGFSATGYTDGATRPARPNYGSTRNPMCRTCRKHQRGTKRCECDAPDYDERPADSSRAFGEWCDQWAAECLRILKPGGHLLAFGGTRTWHRLTCAIEDAGFEIRDSVAWLQGAGFPKSLNVGRAIDGQACRASGTHVDGPDHMCPETPAGDEWWGWGTALKPGWEGIACAQKPYSDQQLLSRIGSWLAQVRDLIIRTGGADGSNDRTGTSASGSTGPMFLSTVTSWRNCWVELCEATSTSTTETTSRTTTDLRTLWSCLERITPASITQDLMTPGGQLSLVELVDNLFGGAVLTSRVTRTLTAIGIATNGMQPIFPDEDEPGPLAVARKPLAAGTVAANVLRYGTGALNIDATRIDGRERTDYGLANAKRSRVSTYGEPSASADFDATKGRWPANVALDDTQAAALDQMSGELTSGKAGADGHTRNKPDRDEGIYGGGRGLWTEAGPAGSLYGDTGGASRFFLRAGWTDDDLRIAERFFYTAKAGSDERITHDGTAHPTVKPLSLMRWLVRLVTPPGGTILEPFAGSGTTVEAALLEGFRCIAVEREADYLPLILQRIRRRKDPVAYLQAAGDDLGLFAEDPL